MATTKQIDSQYLAGLKLCGGTPKKVKVDGVEKTRYIPFERDLKPGDVLDWADNGGTIVIVTTDGKKHIVEKNPKKKEEKEEAGKGGK